MCSPIPISLFCIIMIIQRQYPVEADCLILLISWYIRILEWQNSDKLSISNDIPGILGFTYCYTNYLYIQMLNNDSIKQAYKNYSLGNLNDVLSVLVVVNRINMKTETFLKQKNFQIGRELHTLDKKQPYIKCRSGEQAKQKSSKPTF